MSAESILPCKIVYLLAPRIKTGVLLDVHYPIIGIAMHGSAGKVFWDSEHIEQNP